MQYPANLRCKLAITEERVAHVPQRSPVAHQQRNKRTYDEVDDLLKTSFGSLGKSAIYDKLSTLAGKMAARRQELEQQSDESDNNYMPNDDSEEADDEADGEDSDQDTGENSDEDTEDDDDNMEEEAPITDKILEDFDEYTKQANNNYCGLLPEFQAGIELLLLLHKKRAPVGLYNVIFKWHTRHTKAEEYVTRERLVSTLEERYNMQNNKPFVKSLHLPFSKANINLVCHDFEAQLQSLLTDPRIQEEDYLFFDANNPFAPPPGAFTNIGDINTGRCYRETYKRLVKDPSKQLLLPIIFYLDGAVTGQYDHLPIEALKFTIGILKGIVRDKAYAYRTLGYVTKFLKAQTEAEGQIVDSQHMDAEYYVPNDNYPDDITEETESLTENPGNSNGESDEEGDEDSEEGDDDSEEGDEDSEEEQEEKDAEKTLPWVSLDDFHAMLDAMLATYRGTQGKRIKWRLPYKGKVQEMELIPFVMFVKGDTVEHDKHCGRYGVRTGAVQQLCRYCCTKNADTDEAYIKTKPKTPTMIQKLIDANDKEGLQALSQHAIENAWYKILFGKHNIHGIHGACVAEVLHWIQLGKFKYIREMFFMQTGDKSAVAIGINVLSQTMGMLFKRQSDRDLPRTKFSKGAKTGKLMAHEMTGLMLVLVAVLRSSAGRKLLLTQSRGDSRKYFGTPALIKDWILLLETLLQWEAWLNLPEISVFEVRRFKTKVREMMEMEKGIGQRSKGMGFRTFNFHVCLHIGKDILNYGVPNHSNTKANEMHHKDSKSAALKTQRRPEVFDIQCADMCHEMSIVELGDIEIKGKRKWDYYNTQDLEEETTNHEIEDPDRIRGKVEFVYSQEKNKCTYTVKSKMKEKHLFRLGKQLIDFLQIVHESILDDKAILPIFTEYKRQGQIFRASPRIHRKPWHDWVMVDWGPDGILPAQLHCFLDLRNITGNHDVQGVPVKAGIYAVTETAYEVEEEEEKDMSALFVPYRKDSIVAEDGSIQRQFYLVDVDAFYSTACIIPDIGNDDKRSYLRLLPRADWSDQFSDWLREPHKRDFAEDG